jgi:hypothetical protein
MMKLNLLLVLATLVNDATGAIVDHRSLPTERPVHLGTAGNYVILAKSGISSVPNSAIKGDIAVSPIAATAITGFGLAMDSGGKFSTSSQIEGKAFAADYAPPTPSELTTAVGDMQIAYTDASQRPNSDAMRTNLGKGDISGEILTPGVYTFDVDISINADISLLGGPNDVFILQTTGNLMQADDTHVILEGGAQAYNIFWQVAGHVSVGTASVMKGVLLVKTDVLFMTGSSLDGRVLAQTACNIQMATITESSATAPLD